MAGTRQRGVSGVTLNQFFTAVLKGLGVPVTANNLAKLGAVAHLEGHGGDYNPFNYVLGPGTNFNSVGVKNYPDVNTGIAQTIRLLSQKNTAGMRASLTSNGSYQGWLDATTRFYKSWGGPSVQVTQPSASAKLNSVVDGPVVSAAMRASLGSTAGSAGEDNWATAYAAFHPTTTTSTPAALAAPKAAAMNAPAERQAFDAYLASVGPEKANQIIAELRTARDLPTLATYMSTASPEVNRYIKFMSTLDQASANAESNMLAAPDPAGSVEMTNLLKGLGVSYSNAPHPTPALLAFLRGVGLNLSTAEDVKNRALERIGAATSDAMADIDRTAGRTKQNVTADLVRRNVLSSGESNTRYARHAEDVADRQADVQSSKTTATEGINDTYRQTQDMARQQALDRVISAEQDQATQKATSAAQEDAYRRQQAATESAFTQQQAAQQAAVKSQEEAMAKYAAQGVAV